MRDRSRGRFRVHGQEQPMNAGVVVRDRRALPFFMVRVRALQEIRQHISGPRRARALGLHTLLCQMTNKQRDVGEQIRVTATYRECPSAR